MGDRVLVERGLIYYYHPTLQISKNSRTKVFPSPIEEMREKENFVQSPAETRIHDDRITGKNPNGFKS